MFDGVLCSAWLVTVTAEGIEHEGQADVLTTLRCDRGHGDLFARPLPSTEMTALLTAPPAVPAPRSGLEEPARR